MTNIIKQTKKRKSKKGSKSTKVQNVKTSKAKSKQPKSKQSQSTGATSTELTTYSLGDLTKLLNPNATIPKYTPVAVTSKAPVLKQKIQGDSTDPEHDLSTVPEAVDDSDSEAEIKQLLKSRKKKKRTGDNALNRTIFVGNVSLNASEKNVKELFSQYGKVESVRFRSVAFSNPKKPRKASFITKDFHQLRDTANCYVVFQSQESVAKALASNGTLFHGKHIRVDRAETPKHNHKNSVFVGNLAFDAKEEEVREFFAPAGDILNVRLVRDPHSNIGKGFGFVLFSERSMAKTALSLHGSKLKGRPLRITSCQSSDKIKEKSQRNNKKQSARNAASRLKKKGVFTNPKSASGKGDKASASGPSEQPAWSGQRAGPSDLVRKPRNSAGGKKANKKRKSNNPGGKGKKRRKK